MLEFIHENLLTEEPSAGLSSRLASLVAYCTQVAHDCVDAVGGDMEYFDEGGLRFAVAADPVDLQPDGAVSVFLGASGDPLPEVLFREEGCHRLANLEAHLLVLSIADTSADYLLVADEGLTTAWKQALADLCLERSHAALASA